jgi:hypothetical protein
MKSVEPSFDGSAVNGWSRAAMTVIGLPAESSAIGAAAIDAIATIAPHAAIHPLRARFIAVGTFAGRP